MSFFKKNIVIAFIFIFLWVQAPIGHAFYSPVISEEAGQIKKNLLTVRQTHGVGNFEQIYQRLIQEKQLNASLLGIFAASVGNIALQGVVDSFGLGVGLMIGSLFESKATVTACLRDEIWEMQALQEQVLNEMLKAALLSDVKNAERLWEDYKTLTERTRGGIGGENEKESVLYTFKDTAKWFGAGKQNFYVDCPYGEFVEAWKALEGSWNKFVGTFTKEGALGSFESIKQQAKTRAIRRAQQWIKANRLALTVGGVQGGTPQNLFDRAGWQGFVADFQVEWEFVKNWAETGIIASGIQAFKATNEVKTVNEYVQAYENAQKQKELILNQGQTALFFNLSLNQVSESSLASLDTVLSEMNEVVKQTFETKVGGDNLKGLCESLLSFATRQCKNKTANQNLSCNK